MLCTVCARSDPGERAARREAVESEMQADAESDDPFEAARRNVPARSEAAAREAGFGIGTLFVFGILLLGAFVATTLVLRADPLEIPDHSAELARLEDQDKALRRSVEDLTAALAARETVAPSDLDAAIARIRGELAQGTRELEAQLAGIRNELVKSDTELANRVAKVEASLESQSAQLSALYPLLQSAVERPAREGPGDEGPPAVKPPVRPTAGDSPGGKAPDPKTVDYINDLLNNPGEGVRFSAATELGKLGDPACIPALVKALSADSHFLVRRACARSLGLLKSWYACPALIEALADKEAYVAQQANYALLNITGQDFGVSQDQTVPVRRTKSKAALKWWEKNREFYPEGVDLTPSEM